MAQPPRKRQKQLVVLSSSDAEDNFVYDVEESPEKAHKVLSSRPKTIGALRPRQQTTHASAKSSPASSPKKPLKTAKTVKAKANEHKSGSLYSFFNAKTESQKAPRSIESSQTKTQLAKAAIEADDIIEDESTGDERSVSSQSRHLPPYPAPLRKLSSQSKETIDSQKRPAAPSASGSFLSQSQRFSRPEPKPDVSTQRPSHVNKDERPWAERYGPSNLDELVVHKKKVADVRGWIESAFERRHHHVSLRH